MEHVNILKHKVWCKCICRCVTPLPLSTVYKKINCSVLIIKDYVNKTWRKSVSFVCFLNEEGMNLSSWATCDSVTNSLDIMCPKRGGTRPCAPNSNTSSCVSRSFAVMEGISSVGGLNRSEGNNWICFHGDKMQSGNPNWSTGDLEASWGITAVHAVLGLQSGFVGNIPISLVSEV